MIPKRQTFKQTSQFFSESSLSKEDFLVLVSFSDFSGDLIKPIMMLFSMIIQKKARVNVK